ncbi:SIR2 family protein [Fulvivirga sp. 29W222]|uniref:SIR2 family protein n=1 Tax=Fulvivirga marina TaxID=2494733 RepID=A0A937G0P4_9BACT|nr:SIR2 family protein [Fulvivirga marina]MBL6446351.1 SIR2 family protein [Fulvivirga marina]
MMNSVLFGNGLNRLSATNKSWDELLDEIKYPNEFDNGNLPNTMVYERILFERPGLSNILEEELNVKEKIAKAYENIDAPSIYRELYSLNAQNYLTTNYDYAFRDSILDEFDYKVLNKSTEEIYSIRRKIEIEKNGHEPTNIWHIHGEIQHPKTIMLGLDHYCGEIGKIDAFIKGRYKYSVDGKTKKLKSVKEKLILNELDGVSSQPAK